MIELLVLIEIWASWEPLQVLVNLELIKRSLYSLHCAILQVCRPRSLILLARSISDTMTVCQEMRWDEGLHFDQFVGLIGEDYCSAERSILSDVLSCREQRLKTIALRGLEAQAFLDIIGNVSCFSFIKAVPNALRCFKSR